AYSEGLAKKEQKLGNSGTLAQEVATGFVYSRGLLPTPRASKISGGDRKDFSPSLPGLMMNGLLPTPTTRDYKGARSTEALATAERNETNSLPDYFAQTGKTSQLNPRFVLEMMGFPTTHTLLPFQKKETTWTEI
ncbi:MAG: hypothetical protein ACK5XN_14995, partial [Bacteroidota bacterium]